MEKCINTSFKEAFFLSNHFIKKKKKHCMSSMKHTRHFLYKLGKKEDTWKNKDLDDSSSFTESSDSCLRRMHVSLRVFHEDPCSLLPLLPAEDSDTVYFKLCPSLPLISGLASPSTKHPSGPVTSFA